MKLRRLNTDGIERFAVYLSHLRANPSLPPPAWMLTDDDSSEPMSDVDVTRQAFSSRLSAAQCLHELIDIANLKAADKDIGLWTWLTLFYFDQVCPLSGSIRKPLKENFRYIPAPSDYRKYYRHFLYGPYVIYDAYRSNVAPAMCMLTGPIHITNDVVEQIASRVQWVSNPVVVQVATNLYVDGTTGEFKVGAKGSGNGSPRRFHAILDQLDLTYDLPGMTADRLMALLPSEFDRFRSRVSIGASRTRDAG